MKKRIITILMLALSLSLAFSSCSTTDEPAKGDEKILIGILQLVEHTALDESYRGFVDGLKENGYIDGENITLDFNNAQGNQATANTIADKLVTQKSDLILAIATPAVQAVKNATSDTNIPVVFSAVTDAQKAGIIESNDLPGGNITGVSDLTPVKEQIKLLSILVPDVKKVGLLYSTAEANSEIQIDIAKEALLELGIEYEEFKVSSTNEVQQVVDVAVKKVDAIYTPTDNIIASSISNIADIAIESKTPIIAGEPSMTLKGGLATFGINYYEHGKLSAMQAIEILEGKDPATMPVAHITKFDLVINYDMAEAIGIKIPDNLEDLLK